MIEEGLFRPDEQLELLDGLLVLAEPQHDRHALPRAGDRRARRLARRAHSRGGSPALAR
jgi:hypothetical protein